MKESQKLYPQLIYRINSKLSEVKKASDIKDKQIIAPSVFNPYGRNFHWLVVADDKWELESQWFNNIKKHITDKSNEWKRFKEKYTTDEDKIESKSIENAFNILGTTADKDEYHHALLTIFQFYPVVSHKYIDGIIYRNLERREKDRKDKSLPTHKIDYAIAKLLIEKNSPKTYKLYPWAKVKFYNGENEEKRYSCQENNHPCYPECSPDIAKNGIPEIKNQKHYKGKENCKKYPLTPADVTKNSFFHNYFLPFFTGRPNFKDLSKFYQLTPKTFTEIENILIIPLYDAYIEGKYYGNLCGTLQIPFETEDALTGC